MRAADRENRIRYIRLNRHLRQTGLTLMTVEPTPALRSRRFRGQHDPPLLVAFVTREKVNLITIRTFLMSFDDVVHAISRAIHARTSRDWYPALQSSVSDCMRVPNH